MTHPSISDPSSTVRKGGRPLLDETDRVAGRLPRPLGLPILWITVLYLVTTGRWGSYAGIPGLPVYGGDILLAAAAVQVVLQLRRAGTTLRDIGQALARADMALLLCLSLLAWVTVRGVFSIGMLMKEPLVGLRDAAPYAYAAAALLAFLVPAGNGDRQRRLVYAALTLHVTWILVGQRLPGSVLDNVLLGGAPILTARPDFDSAVAGAAIAFTLYDVLLGRRPRAWRTLVALCVLMVANGYAISGLQTRSGLLAGIVGIGVVLLIWVTRSGARQAGQASRGQRLGVLGASIVVLCGAVALSPPGQRLTQAVTGQESQALGTVQVREYAWKGVATYVFSDAARTAVGVGFGPDFIQDAGVAYALEGTEYKDVRSPHNYILGTMARLGLAGALLTVLTVLAGASLAVRRLSGPAEAVTVLAALLLLTLPVTALLGVVLESPFGAIPYFWAIGQLARRAGDPGSHLSRDGFRCPSRRTARRRP